MKIEKRNDKLIVFLNKKISPKLDLSNKLDLEKYFQKLFTKLNNIYELDISGSYDVNIFNNKIYGMILEIKQQDTEYFDYYDEIDMKITVSKNDEIIYKINGYYEQLKNNCEFYSYNGIIYASPKKINFQKLGILIEHSEIIYGKECEKIKKNAQKLNTINL